MKKLVSVILFQFFILGLIFGATINSKEGYENLRWGASVFDARKAGYKLTAMTTAADMDYLSKLYTVDVESFYVTSKDNNVLALQFHYYNGKLFFVTETLKLKELSQQKLEKRYGNFSSQGISLYGEQYMDVKFEKGGVVSSLSISISNSSGNVSTFLYDWDTYKNISYVGQQLSGKYNGVGSTIVDAFETMASNLVQENFYGTKSSFAILPFTTDYQNELVENYVTDALTEAMFNTGKVKIFERSNLDPILEELKFQETGLVNQETAKSIGMLAGVEFVCYGTLKDTGDGFTVNARVVDVETGEICAMSRASIFKDDYLKQQPQSAVGAVKTTGKSTKSASTSTQPKVSAKSVDSAWEVVSFRDDFSDATQYIFKVRSSDERMLVVNYKKCDNSASSRVVAGIYWTSERNGIWNYSYSQGRYDIKGTESASVTKDLNNDFNVGLDSSGKNYFTIVWDEKSGARWLVDIIRKSDSVAFRRDGLTRRFQTAGLLDKMAEYGITWNEIDAALTNEEF